jgi:sugar/nucleoside kinase (ribokinase family)
MDEDSFISKKNKIISVGHIALDYIFNVEKFPEPNTSVQIPSARKYYGGAACNVAVGVAKLGLPSGIVSCVGYDFKNSGYERYLKNLGVDISHIYHSEEEETPKAWIFTDENNNQITFFLWGAAKHYKELNPPLFEAEIVHLATGDPEFNAKCSEKARKNNILVSFDPGQDLPLYNKDTMERVIKNTNFLFMNKHEFDRTLKLLNTDLEDLRKKVDVLIITHGKDGSVIYTKDDEIKIPCFKAKEVVDPTGAGDSYRAGFLTGYVKGYSLEQCGLIGSCVASFVVEKKGCQTNLPSWNDVIERLKKEGFTLE